MRKIKGVFFDLGGTLRICEEAPEHQERAKARMAELAGRTDVQAFIDMVEERYAPYRDWALTENREAGDFELWDKWLLPEYGKERLAAVCHELTYQYRQAKGLRHVVPGGLKVIRGLYERGFRLGIISNLIGENEIPDWLREDGLAQYFDAVVLSSVCHIRKPDPEIYRRLLSRYSLEAQESVFLDDTAMNVEAAERLGIHGICFRTKEQAEEELRGLVAAEP